MGGRGGITSQAAQGHDAGPKFEYDPAKSAANKEKHGIDFEEAKALWRDEKRISFPSKYENELRYINIAKYNERHYVAVTTIRGNNIRIISVRRARNEEVVYYDKTANVR